MTRLRRFGAAAAAAAGAIVVLAVVLNWLVVREAGDTVGADIGAIHGKTPCPKPDGSSRRVMSFAHPPPRCIKSATAYTAELTTANGAVTIALDARRAPVAVNNFVVLARYHFYDGMPLEHGAVIQTAARNPGYAIADERPPAGAYRRGSVAMTSTGPGTSGGQFFVVTGDGLDLVPIYPLVGEVTSGLDVLGTATAIASVTIREA